MKKNFIKLGALALVLVLTLMFAACAEPTEEVVNYDTVIRLWFEKGGKSLGAGDKIAIDLGRFDDTHWSTGSTSFGLTEPGYYIDALATNINGTNTENTNVNNGGTGYGADAMDFDREIYGESIPPIRTATGLPATSTFGIPADTMPFNVGGVSIGMVLTADQITITKDGTYVDLFLYRTLIDASTPTSTATEVWQKSGSYYVKLYVEPTSGGIQPGVYIYTPGKFSRNQPTREFPNDPNTPPIYNTSVKRFSFKPGINNLYLANFSM
jgi:hypothetical protein